MTPTFPRREALRHLVVLSAAAVVPAALAACSKSLSCRDVAGLSADDARMRSEIAKYVEPTMDAAKPCSTCAQYVPAAPDTCGGCKVVKGPIHPNGSCALWAAKPA